MKRMGTTRSNRPSSSHIDRTPDLPPRVRGSLCLDTPDILTVWQAHGFLGFVVYLTSGQDLGRWHPMTIFYITSSAPPACRGEDTTMFVGPDGEDRPAREFREQLAKSICRGCPLIGECLDWALAAREYGVWGMTNEEDRKAIRTGRTMADPSKITDQSKRRIEREKRAWALCQEGLEVEEISDVIGVRPATVYEYIRSQRKVRDQDAEASPVPAPQAS